MLSDPIRSKVAAVRRQHILQAAIKVFAERGFHRATIKAVAAEAGVSDGSIYNSFPNKEALLLGVIDPFDEASAPKTGDAVKAPEDIGSVIRDMLRRRWQSLTPETLASMRVILAEVLTNERLRAMYMERVIAPALELPASAFKLHAAAGQMRSTDIALTVRFLTATVLGLVMLHLLGEKQTAERWNEMPDALADQFLFGLLKLPSNEAQNGKRR